MSKLPLYPSSSCDSHRQQRAIHLAHKESRTVNALWLAIHLSKFPIELQAFLTSDHCRDRVRVAIKRSQGRMIVHTASKTAEYHGIRTGMTCTDAYALYPALEVVEFNPGLQKKYLEKIAAWASQFTSKVNIHDGSVLILEVLGSVKLFGSLCLLVDVIKERFKCRWPFMASMAVTPSPLASVLLARNGKTTTIIETHEALRSRLGGVDLSVLPLPIKTRKQLRQLGLICLRDLWRLPRKDVLRRYGAGVISYLDKLLGIIPYPLEFYRRNETFKSSWPLAFETSDGLIIRQIVRHLFKNLEQFLRQRGACISGYHVVFHYETKPTTQMFIGFRQPSRDFDRFSLLFEERISRYVFSAPIVGVAVHANNIEEFISRNVALPFSAAESIAESSAHYQMEDFLEILQVRLKANTIKTLRTYSDHRPEYAYGLNQDLLQSEKTYTTLNDRPLWLLSKPQLLAKKNNCLHYHTPLTFVSGPERIESGWWSSQDIQRDYYIAKTEGTQQLWVYREINPPRQWYLHGLFA